MWLLAFIPTVIGVLRYRHWSYWRWVVAICIWQAGANFLFASHGSLALPEHDGLISRAIRQATDDGPMFGLFAVAFLVVFYGGVLYFIHRLYLEAKATDPGATAHASRSRKAVELTALSLMTGWLVYLNTASMAAADADKLAAMSVETRIDDEVAIVGPTMPVRVDEITILTSARREQRTLVLTYDISEPALTRETLRTYLQNDKAKEACANPRTRRIVEDGGLVSYRYRLAAGGEPVTFNLSAPLCTAPQKNSSISR